MTDIADPAEYYGATSPSLARLREIPPVSFFSAIGILR